MYGAPIGKGTGMDRTKTLLVVGLTASLVLNVCVVSVLVYLFGQGALDRADEIQSSQEAAVAEALQKQEAELAARFQSQLNEAMQTQLAELTRQRDEQVDAAYRRGIEEAGPMPQDQLIVDLGSSGPDLPFPARRRYVHPYQIAEDQDEFLEITTLELEIGSIKDRITDGLRIGLGDLRLYVWSSFIEDGQRVEPRTIHVRFVVEGSLEYGWIFLDCNHTNFLADSKRITTAVDWDGDTDTSLEFIHADVSTQDFLAMISARRVRGKICNTEFELSSTQVEAMRDYASRLAVD